MLWGRDSEAGRTDKNSDCNVDKRTGRTERDPEMEIPWHERIPADRKREKPRC